jgi:hypothetical protein
MRSRAQIRLSGSGEASADSARKPLLITGEVTAQLAGLWKRCGAEAAVIRRSGADKKAARLLAGPQGYIY